MNKLTGGEIQELTVPRMLRHHGCTSFWHMMELLMSLLGDPDAVLVTSAPDCCFMQSGAL